jgi:hypothetical protein
MSSAMPVGQDYRESHLRLRLAQEGCRQFSLDWNLIELGAQAAHHVGFRPQSLPRAALVRHRSAQLHAGFLGNPGAGHHRSQLLHQHAGRNGVFGLLSYLGITLLIFLRGIREARQPLDPYLRRMAFGLLIGLLGCQFALFFAGGRLTHNGVIYITPSTG